MTNRPEEFKAARAWKASDKRTGVAAKAALRDMGFHGWTSVPALSALCAADFWSARILKSGDETMNETKRMQELALDAASAFEQATRPDGSRFLLLSPSAPAWMTEMIRDAAHDDAEMLPDDYRYAMARDALEAIADDPENEDAPFEWEADVYTSGLAEWLASHVTRAGWVEGAIEEYGWNNCGGLHGALARGQEAEYRHVFYAIRAWLEEHADEGDVTKALDG